jgi:hypothetical protein
MALTVPFPSDGLIERKTSRGYMRDLLIPSSFDYDVFEDNFKGDAVDAIYPAAKVDTGAVSITEHSKTGLLLTTTAANDKYAGQGLGMNWNGDRGCLLEGILVMPASLAATKIEFGFTDDDQSDTGAVNVKAGLTSNATDYAVFVYDTDDSTNATAFGFTSSKGGTEVATVDLVVPVVDTTYRWAVRIEGDSVSAYINGTQVAGGAHLIEGGTQITPWVFVQARAGTNHVLQLHKWRVTQPAY